MRRLMPSILACLSVLACAVHCPAKPSAPPSAAKGFGYGPYLQNVTPSSLALVWITKSRKSAAGEATLTGPDGKTIKTSAVVKGPAGHAVFTKSLAAATTYKWQVKLADGTTATGEAKTAPDKPTDFRFIAYGDTRGDETDTPMQVHRYLLKFAAAKKPAFVIHTGDFVDQGQEWKQWQSQFLDICAPLMRTVPLYPTVGNHELDWDESRGDILSDGYQRCFNVPAAKEAKGRWYSFQWGDATFFMIDHYSGFTEDSPQHKWLAAALAACKTTWKFVANHEPPFSSSRRNGSVSARKLLVPLFEKHKVTAVFSGHDHCYSRSVKAGVTYVVAGGGGAPLYPVKVTDNPHEKCSRSCYHYCTVDVTAKKVTITTYDIIGKKFDTATIAKP